MGNKTWATVYKEYIDNHHSYIFDTWEEAEGFLDYLKSISHVITHKLKMTNCDTLLANGKPGWGVHVCEPFAR